MVLLPCRVAARVPGLLPTRKDLSVIIIKRLKQFKLQQVVFRTAPIPTLSLHLKRDRTPSQNLFIRMILVLSCSNLCKVTIVDNAIINLSRPLLPPPPSQAWKYSNCVLTVSIPYRSCCGLPKDYIAMLFCFSVYSYHPCRIKEFRNFVTFQLK